MNSSLGHNVAAESAVTFAEAAQATGMHSSLGHNVTDKLSVTFAEAAQANGMNASVGNNVTEIISATFAEDTAKKTGFTQRTIRRDVQIATRIPDDVRELLRATPVAERSPRPAPTPSAPRPKTRLFVLAPLAG